MSIPSRPRSSAVKRDIKLNKLDFGNFTSDFNLCDYILGIKTHVTPESILEGSGFDMNFVTEVAKMNMFSEPEVLHNAGGGCEKQPEFLCRICKEIKTSDEELQAHLISAHAMKITNNNVVQHVTGGGVFTPETNVCKNCNKGFKLKVDFIAHNTITARMKCIFCSSEFPCIGAWSTHSMTHLSRLKDFECIVCGSALNTRHNLLTHSSTHVDNLGFDCPFCFDKKSGNAIRYRTIKGITGHLKRHDASLLEQYKVPDII